MHDFW